MLQFISTFSTYLIVLSGLSVIILGDWRNFKLKYAPVVLSTVAGMWLVVSMNWIIGPIECNFDARTCTTVTLYAIMRNIAFILFHIAVGRDAIKVKRGDRRAA